jgi:ABC-2 type transport system ATP-binding protein
MISVQNLKKHYGAVKAVDDVSFEIAPGEVVGLLGPNGAGKSTTMKILTCYLPCTAGTASVDGHDCTDDPIEVRRRIGYLPERNPLYEDMTVREYLEFAWTVRRMPKGRFMERLRDVTESCGLETVLQRPIGQLSKGFRQRVGLAQAMIHDPQVLILDEPTSGLDVAQIIEMRELIQRLGKTKTVVLSTHILQEVAAVCSRLLIISEGKLVASGTQEEIIRAAGVEGTVRVVLKSGIDGDPVAAFRALPAVTKVSSEPRDGELHFTLTVTSGPLAREGVSEAASRQGWTVLELTDIGADLEAAFLKLTRKESA